MSFSLIRGIDPGTNHPTVCLWARVIAEKKIVHVFREYFKAGLIISDNCDNIKSLSGHEIYEWTVIDPSINREDPITKRSLKDEWTRNGIICVDGDRRERGKDIVKMFLKKGMVKIDPSCHNLIRELQLLQYGDKEGDDCTDALRYLLVRVHDLMFGEEVFLEKKDERKFPYKKEFSFYDFFPEQKKDNEEINWIIEEANG